MKKITCFFLLIISLFNLTSCGFLFRGISHNSLDEFFSDWSAEEIDNNIAISFSSDERDKLLWNGEEKDVTGWLYDWNVVAIVDNICYRYDETSSGSGESSYDTVMLYAIDLTTKSTECLCEHVFPTYEEYNDPKKDYNLTYSFYVDGNIFIYDTSGSAAKFNIYTILSSR